MSTLELTNIAVTADGHELVRDVSLTLRSGEVHILMGPNGSGKSSLLNAIMGHPKYTRASGAIMLDGEDITALPTEKKAKSGLFLSLQHLPEIAGVSLTNFLHRAVRETTGSTMTPLEFYAHMKALASAAGIDPEFLKKHVNSGLSGGEKKQSEALQLVALRPKFAFLDEIDSGVDVDAMKKVYAIIEQMKGEGVGFLLVTHFTNILDHVAAEKVHVMRDGKLVATGGKELMARVRQEGFEGI
jgi:Fe-S cluster assembly ATP-binding protein